MLERYNGRTPGVQGTAVPSSLVQLLYTQSTGIVKEQFMGGVQSRTEGVRICRSMQIIRQDLLNILQWSNGRTPGVQGATGLRTLVRLLYTQPMKAVRNLLEEAVQIRTAGVHKCHSLQIVSHGIVNMLERYNSHTSGVQETAGPPSLVQLLYTQSTGIVKERFVGGIQICTAGVHKCRSLQIVQHDLVNMFEWSNGHTPGVQGATGLRSLVQLVYTQPNATVRRPTSESCTDPYSRCKKMPFAADCLPRPSELA